MYKFRDCFYTCGVFNEAIVKRFEETWDPEQDDRLWISPGHVIYTNQVKKLYTCDARPFDLPTVTEPDCVELTMTSSPILDIHFETERSASRMYVVLRSGDIHIFEYRALLYEWARVGFFNVNIISPNNLENHSEINEFLISIKQGVIYWTEKVSDDQFGINMYRRSLPSSQSVREITQSAIGNRQVLLKNCPSLEIFEIKDSICIIPCLPNGGSMYLILSGNFHLWLFDISGKCLWRGIFSNHAIDFLSLCIKACGFLCGNNMVKVCRLLAIDKSWAYILHGQTLLSISATGEIYKKVECELDLRDSNQYYIYQNMLCVFTGSSFNMYSIENGQMLQVIDLDEYLPIKGMWYHTSNIPSIGFYSSNVIQQLHFKSLKSMLISDISIEIPNTRTQENVHVFSLMKLLVQNNINESSIPCLLNFPTVLQSEALVLAVVQMCRERGSKFSTFPLKPSVMHEILASREKPTSSNTKLRKLLESLVECYFKIESKRV